jgi:hypothetical protein
MRLQISGGVLRVVAAHPSTLFHFANGLADGLAHLEDSESAELSCALLQKVGYSEHPVAGSVD